MTKYFTADTSFKWDLMKNIQNLKNSAIIIVKQLQRFGPIESKQLKIY